MPAARDFTLVVPHVPKTAGTSLRQLLESHYGPRLFSDYADTPLQKPRWRRRFHALSDAARRAGQRLEAGCVYGHFLPLKYAFCSGTRFAVWLRDPVQRVVSRYHHYQRAVAAGETAHQRWGLRPGLSLEAFVCLPQYRNTYAEYFWGFSLSRFEFIGRVEDFSTDLPGFLRRFELPDGLSLPFINTNPEKQRERYSLEPAAERLIRQMNQDDLRIYERLLEKL